MTRRVLHILLVAALLIVSAGALHAQKYPERKHIRSGNKEFQKENFVESEVEYRRAQEKAPESYEAAFNLADALYKQERYGESAEIFQRLAQDTAHVDNSAAAYYNAGNALFQERKLQEALEAYKSSLRQDPTDMDAKFNLAYVKKLLDEQQGGGGGGNNDQNKDQNQDQNQQGNQDQNGDQNQDKSDKGDQNKDKGDQDQDKGDKDKGDQDQGKDKGDQNKDKGDGQDDKGKNDDKPQGGQQPQQQGMSKGEADQMLEAIQAQEDKTQEKVDEKKKGVAVRGSRKNW